MIKIEKYFQYTQIDSKNLAYFREQINGIIINGNVYAHSKKTIFENTIANNVSALIDPMFYMLQAKIKHQSSETKIQSKMYKIKPSLLKLLDIYKINYKDILPEEFSKDHKIYNKTFLEIFIDADWDIKTLVEHSKNIMKEQNEFYEKNIHHNSILFKDIFENRNKEKKLLIAPLLIPKSRIANDINNAIIKDGSFNCYPIYIDKESFENGHYKNLLEKISEIKYDEVFLWIEKDVKKHSNEIFNLIKKLEIENIAMRYANYKDMISIQEKELKITKWINAFGYGEDRNILPIGGGLPVNKVYSPIQHKRLNFEDFYEEYNLFDDYLKEYCGCRTCKEIILTIGQGGPFYYAEFNVGNRRGREFQYATGNARKISTRHFVWNKLKEINAFNNNKKLKDHSSLWNNE